MTNLRLMTGQMNNTVTSYKRVSFPITPLIFHSLPNLHSNSTCYFRSYYWTFFSLNQIQFNTELKAYLYRGGGWLLSHITLILQHCTWLKQDIEDFYTQLFLKEIMLTQSEKKLSLDRRNSLCDSLAQIESCWQNSHSCHPPRNFCVTTAENSQEQFDLLNLSKLGQNSWSKIS